MPTAANSSLVVAVPFSERLKLIAGRCGISPSLDRSPGGIALPLVPAALGPVHDHRADVSGFSLAVYRA